MVAEPAWIFPRAEKFSGAGETGRRPRTDPAMANYVLVHGMWHGGWCWRAVARLLRSAGHEVQTPTLTGMGERSHLLSPMAGVQWHVEDVVNVLRYEDLHDVLLVGHSYAGMVITGVAGRVPERLRTLVYLDAYLPRDGQAGLDLREPEANRHTLEEVRTQGAGWRMPPPPVEKFRVQAEEARTWVEQHLCEAAFRGFAEPLRIEREWTGPRVFVRATDYPCAPFDALYQRALEEPGWQAHRVVGGHDLMVDAPDEVARILLDLAEA